MLPGECHLGYKGTTTGRSRGLLPGSPEGLLPGDPGGLPPWVQKDYHQEVQDCPRGSRWLTPVSQGRPLLGDLGGLPPGLKGTNTGRSRRLLPGSPEGLLPGDPGGLPPGVQKDHLQEVQDCQRGSRGLTPVSPGRPLSGDPGGLPPESRGNHHQEVWDDQHHDKSCNVIHHPKTLVYHYSDTKEFLVQGLFVQKLCPMSDDPVSSTSLLPHHAHSPGFNPLEGVN